MPLFFGEKKDIVLIIDVGSASVGAALVLLKGSDAPLVLRSVRTPVQFQAHLRFDRLLKLTLKALEESVGAVLDRSFGKPSKAFCFLAAPWYGSEVRTVKFGDGESEFTFDEKLMDHMVSEELSRFAGKEMERYERLQGHIYLIENKVIDVRLNGYRTDNPMGVRAKEAELSLLLCLAPDQAVTEFIETIRRIIHGVPIVFHSFLLPFFAVLRDLYHGTEDALLIDIGGEVTEVSLMRGGLLLGTVSFPLGKNFVLRRTAAILKKEPEEIRSLLKLLFEGKIDAAERKALEPGIVPVRKEWLAAFNEALDELNTLLVPDTVLLFADGDIVKWFIDAVEKEEYGQYALSAGKFAVTTVGGSLLHKHLSFGDTIERDRFIALESIYLGTNARP
ncbi:hypothetical protein KW797_01460 [Candidatus Parcubacteria bacterium]|nr:hypothetical protein [Candidatus Parcubacteria bacterium]